MAETMVFLAQSMKPTRLVALVSVGLYSCLSLGLLGFLHLRDPETYGVEAYGLGVTLASSIIVGAFFGSRLQRVCCTSRSRLRLLGMAALVPVADMVIMAQFLAVMTLLSSRDVHAALFAAVFGIPVMLVHYGAWKAIQAGIFVTVVLLVAGRYPDSKVVEHGSPDG